MSNTDKHWATWILDGFVAIGAIAQIIIGYILICQLNAYEASNDLTRQSLELSKKNFDLTAKSVDLTEKSLEATQQALKFSHAANDISAKNLKIANTAWIGIQLVDHKEWENGMEVDYTVANNSDIPAHHVWAVCAIQGHPYIFDKAAFGDINGAQFAILPKQTATYNAEFISTENCIPIRKQIESGKLTINIVVDYENSLGDKVNFIETFRKVDGMFEIDDEQYDVPFEKVEKILNLRNIPAKKK